MIQWCEFQVVVGWYDVFVLCFVLAMNISGREHNTQRRPLRPCLPCPVTHRVTQSAAEPRATEAVQRKVGSVTGEGYYTAGALEESRLPALRDRL